MSRDVDAVLWLGQAEELQEKTNFWEAIERVNQELSDQELSSEPCGDSSPL